MQTVRRRLVIGERLYLGFAFLLTCSLCYFVSHNRPMWSDELFAWMLVTDPLLSHLMVAWRAGADGGGMGFYLILRGWLDVFGQSVLAFRMFSAIGIYGGLLFFWLAARRFYRFVPLAAATFFIWFSGRAVMWHMVQTRFYGLLLAMTGFALYAQVRANRTAESGEKALALTFVSHLLLAATHPFGLIYSGVLIASAVLVDRSYGRWRPRLYLSALAGWVILLPSREAMRSTAAVGKPHFWTRQPNWHDLRAVYLLGDNTPSNHHVVYLLIVLLTLGAAAAWLSRDFRGMDRLADRRVILVPTGLLAMVPLGVWIVSQWGTSLFVGRYMIPLCFGVAIFAAEVMQRTLDRQASGGRRWPLLAVQILAIGVPVMTTPREILLYARAVRIPQPDFTGDLLALLPRDRPCVMERVDVFDVMMSERRRAGVPFVFLLDWEVAMAGDSPIGDVAGYHEMENWRKVGYYSGSILDSSSFLEHTDHFTVVDDPLERWFEDRIAGKPEWKTVPVAVFETAEERSTIWKVDRVTSGAGAH